MSLWLMRQGLDDDTDTDMTNASALESAAFALCCIVAAAILCVASAFAWDLPKFAVKPLPLGMGI